MSRSTRGRSLSFRHAATFSLTVISSSAPVSQNTHDSGRITRWAFCSSASRSTQSLSMNSLFPGRLPRRAITPLHVCITEMRCRGARRRGRLRLSPLPGVFPCRPARPSTADKRKTFRELHKSGCFVIPNPWNVGSARYLQGLGFKALATTSSGHAHSEGYPDGAQTHGRGAGALSRACGGDRHSAQRRFRERLCRRSRQGRRERHALHRHRRRRAVDRGLAATVGDAALRLRRGAGPREGGARRDRQGRRRRGVHRAHRGLHPRPAGHRRDHPPAQGVRRRRRRLPLFAGHQDPRAHRSHREGGGRQGDQLPQQRRVRLHGERPRRHGRAAHQRRRLAGAGGDARLHQDGDARSPRTASSTASPA